MKKLILSLLLTAFCSCIDDPPVTMTENKVVNVINYKLDNVEGLKDCSLFFLVRYLKADLTVVRCPNSSTTVTHNCGKNCTQTITTIDSNKEPD